MLKLTRFATVFAIFIVLLDVLVVGLKRPDDDKKKWQSKAKAASSGVNYNLYANGRGKVNSGKGKSDCDGKWQDAETYGARQNKIKQFCVRLHEKHQDDKGYTDAPKKYSCRLDPNDKGNDNGRKNRDWLCYEKSPKYVLLPPHGPEPNGCVAPLGSIYEDRVFSWYPKDSPPSWCHYNWYEDRQVCWCMPGFYRESPYDPSLKKRGCPEDEEIFIAPKFVKKEAARLLQQNNTVLGYTEDGDQCSCSEPFA
ncbi:hypothetical protein FOL47_003844 [Perkinsus chesapeaki]|uniref:Uncharacterized protein n=1 Tax=Perkinsus chesapeaki TaxID=330153 RepID=A0A7J6M6V6_PERCH|nr:hypothetical protein FOL47_003844 [Perkinsus chesapeaki]